MVKFLVINLLLINRNKGRIDTSEEVYPIGKITKEECANRLKAKAAEVDRIPKKSDFTENEVAVIKAYFGPWPRALEAVGLKTPKVEGRKEKNNKKREMSRQRRKMHKQKNVDE